MAISKVAIANRALQKLGAGRISSLAQDHPNARSMSAAYPIIRDELLRRYTWGFSVKRASIAADGDQTAWGSHNRYSLPNDFLRLIRDDESGSNVDWRIEGLYVVTDDASPLKIRYVASIDDPNFYDSLFVEAFASKLAYECCEEITQSSGKKDRALRDFDNAIATATSTGALEKPAEDWLAARR
jgi:hypothetical protein